MIHIIKIKDKDDNELFSIGLGDSDYFIYQDKYYRRWKLTPVTNKNIKFPFIITFLGDEK